ncbi:MAG: YdeI/OmpD-associated family protein [Bacteroidota bacterium]
MRTFTTHLVQLYDSSTIYYGVFVPAQEADDFIDNDRRVVCSINNTKGFQGALMHDGNGDFFINLNKEKRRELELKPNEPFEVTLKKDNSKYGAPMPEELEVLLEQDEEGSHYFHELTPGKQRSLIYLVSKPKQSDTRLRKAIIIVDFLKTNKGKLDTKALNQAFKEYPR